MIRRKNLRVVLLGIGISLLLFSGAAQAQLSVTGSNLNVYFGSQNDGYQASDPINLNPWPAVTNAQAPYNTLTVLPGVPTPAGGIKGAYTGNAFSPTPWLSGFSDGFGNSAASIIQGLIGSSGTVDDAQISTNMFLNQNGLLPNYTYEQLNYEIDYLVLPGPGALGTTVTRSFNVSGNVATSGYVDFGGEMNFWDVTTSSTAIPLGTLKFFYFNNTGGPFSAPVNGSANITGTVPPGDTLRVAGDFFLIGDPSQIQINSVPEPSSCALLGLGSLTLLASRRRRHG